MSTSPVWRTHIKKQMQHPRSSSCASCWSLPPAKGYHPMDFQLYRWVLAVFAIHIIGIIRNLLWCQTFFTQHYVWDFLILSRVLLVCTFSLFIVFPCVNIKFIHSTPDGQLVPFLFWAIVNSAAVNIFDMSFGVHMGISVGSGISRS